MTTQELETLVDPTTIRRSIKRLFSNTADEILGELFQNSQRACASRVDITMTDTQFTYHDNGNGLENGIESFHTLLAMAKSYFNNSTIEDQDPMGLGIHSLIAHDTVTGITFKSGNHSLSIDTARWWTEPSYYTTWHERMEIIPFVAGFTIEVLCGSRLLKEIELSLERKNGSSYSYAPRQLSPAAGYGGILEITLQEKPVDTSVPNWCKPAIVLCHKKYEGCDVVLGITDRTGRQNSQSSVIWYGQLIRVPLSEFRQYGALCFQITVTSGHPLNPMSPSRRGIIVDERFHAFLKWCEDAIFQHYKETPSLEFSVQYVSSLFEINNKRALKELPTFLAKELIGSKDMDYYGDGIIIETGKNEIVLRYDQTKVNVIEDTVAVLDEDSDIQFSTYGLATFLNYMPEQYYCVELGDKERIPERHFYWKPGKPQGRNQYPDAEPSSLTCFFEPGEWGIMVASVLPTTLAALPEDALVYTLESQDSYNCRACDWRVGTKDPMLFLSDPVKIGFDRDVDDGVDAAERDYDESVAAWSREIIGNAVPSNFNVNDARSIFMPPEYVVTIGFEYPSIERRKSSPYPQYATFTSNLGNTVRRLLLN